MPRLRRVPLGDIDEPKLPIRIAMDDDKMADLADSMASIGLLQPIGLKPAAGRLEIEFGHRRYLAAVKLKWADIPALVFTTTEVTAGAAMLAENICREDITAAEEAVLFAQAQEQHHLDEAGLIKMFRRSADYIGDRLRLLRDDLQVFEALRERKINFSVARELNKCSEETQRRYFLDCAMRGQVGARVVAEWVAGWRANYLPSSPTSPTPPPVTEQQVPSIGVPACCICGGHLDPYNLVNVYIHRHELDHIQAVLRGDKEEQPA